MKRILSAFLLTLSLSTQAGLPPTTLSGQSQTVKPTTFSFKTPYNQSTKISGTESLIETGNANVLADPGAEATTTPWSAYKDAVSATPENGVTDGAAPSYITCANSATAPLAGTKSFLMTKISASNAQGEGCSIPFTIPTSSTYKVNRLSFDYAIASGTYADDEIEWFVYDVTNGVMKPFTPSKLKNHSLPSETFAPNGEFQASDSTSYRLIAHIAGTSASAYSLKFDNFKLGVFEKTYGGMGDDVYSGTVTTTTGAVTNPDKTFITSCTAANPSVCTISGFTVAPKCWAGVSDVSWEGASANATSSTSMTVYTYLTSGISQPNKLANVFCRKSGIDYERAMGGRVMSNDADTRVVNFVGYVASNQALTANVTDLPLTVKKDSHSCWTGSACVIKVPGDYMVTGASYSTATAGALKVYVNGTHISYLQNLPLSAQVGSGSVMAENLKAGDVLSIRADTTLTLAGSAINTFSITKASGPSQIAASESVYFTANTSTTAATSSAPFIYTNVLENSHGAYSAITGKFTSPSNRMYQCNASAYSVTAGSIAFYKNGSSVYYGTYGSATTAPSHGSYSTRLLQGETIEVRPLANATASGGAQNNSFNCFSIGL